MDKMIACPRCGTKLKPDQHFCDGCGLPRSAHSLAAGEQPTVRLGRLPLSSRLTAILAILGAALVALVAAVVGSPNGLQWARPRSQPTATLILAIPTLPPLRLDTPVVSRATRTPRPDLPLDLVQTASYTDTVGGRVFVGVARNRTGQPLGGAGITLSLLDAAGRLLGTGSSYDYTSTRIEPDERLPFRLRVSSAPATWATTRWQLQGRSLADLPDTLGYRALDVLDARLQAPTTTGVFDLWHLIGQVRNRGDRTVAAIHVSAAIYRGATLLDVDDTYSVIDRVAPGDTVPFSIQFLHPPATGPDRFEIWTGSYVK